MSSVTTHKPPHTSLIMLLISVAAIVAVLPSATIPVLADFFHISNNYAQAIITVELVGYVTGQLIYGPLANRFGYRHAMIMGIILCLFGLIICFASYYLYSYPILLFGRLIAALGSSSCLVCTFILIDDQFDRQGARRVITFGVFALNVGSNIAITIGGFLTDMFNWSACYLFLFGYCFIAIFIAGCVKPNREVINKDALQIKRIVRGYMSSFSSRNLVAFSLLLSLSASLSYLYAASAPLIAVHQLHLDSLQYGLWNSLNIIGLLGGLFVMSRYSARFNEIQFLYFCIPAILVIGTLMLLFMLHASTSILLFFVLTSSLYFVSTLIYPNASTLALASHDKKADASATMTFLNIGNTTLMVTLLTLMPGTSGWEYTQMLFILVAVGCLMLFLSHNKSVIKQQA